MSIASELSALSTNLQAAKDAVVTKGGTVGDTGLLGLADEISSIPSGGGGVDFLNDPVSGQTATQYGKIWYLDGIYYPYLTPVLGGTGRVWFEKTKYESYNTYEQYNNYVYVYPSRQVVSLPYENWDSETGEQQIWYQDVTFAEIGAHIIGTVSEGEGFYGYEVTSQIEYGTTQHTAELDASDWGTDAIWKGVFTLHSGEQVMRVLRIDFGSEYVTVPNRGTFVDKPVFNNNLRVSQVGDYAFSNLSASGLKIQASSEITVGTNFGQGTTVDTTTGPVLTKTSIGGINLVGGPWSFGTNFNTNVLEANSPGSIIARGGIVIQREFANKLLSAVGSIALDILPTATGIIYFSQLSSIPSGSFPGLAVTSSLEVNFGSLQAIGDNCFVGCKGVKLSFGGAQLASIGNGFGKNAHITFTTSSSRRTLNLAFVSAASQLTIGNDFLKGAFLPMVHPGVWNLFPSTTSVTVGDNFMQDVVVTDGHFVDVTATDTALTQELIVPKESPGTYYYLMFPASIVSAGNNFCAGITCGASYTLDSGGDYGVSGLVFYWRSSIYGIYGNANKMKLQSVGDGAFYGSDIVAVWLNKTSNFVSTSALTVGEKFLGRTSLVKLIMTKDANVEVKAGFCGQCMNLQKVLLSDPVSTQQDVPTAFDTAQDASTAAAFLGRGYRGYRNMSMSSSWATVLPNTSTRVIDFSL